MSVCGKSALFFDLDGTLIDSVPDLAGALNVMLHRLGLGGCDETQVRDWIGDGARTLVRRALLAQMDDRKAQEMFDVALAIFMEAYGTMLCEKTVPYPGVDETLTYCRKKGSVMALVTNKPERFVAPILRTMGWGHLFDAVVGGDTLTTKKPDPAPLLHLCQTLSIRPEEVWMVGDSCNDILAAERAGIRSAGVVWGYGADAFGKRCKPTVTIGRMTELKEILNG